MCQPQEHRQAKQDTGRTNTEASRDMLRRLSMVKKAVGRLVRRAFSSGSQYPELFAQVENALERLRTWIRTYGGFWNLPAFERVLAERLHELHKMIQQLQTACQPAVTPGKREKSRLWQAYRKQCRALEKMLSCFLPPTQSSEGAGRVLAWAFEAALRATIERLQSESPSPPSSSGSQRGERTLIFPWGQLAGYDEVEPETLLVWHLDDVDHVDEATLCASFEAFAQHIAIKVLGVTKDQWQPSTTALKQIFHGIWIAFCHRHELKKWRQALVAYQDAVQCGVTERQRLYQRVKMVLDRAESGTVLRLKLKGMEQEEPAFRHPILQVRLKVLQDNAARYTCHHKRHGLTKTASIVDNFLKQVKRKLRQMESFRDQECTRTFFRAMATVRNFVPFLSGAKNAHQSPFMLAQGETYDVPWAQVLECA